MRRAFAAGFKGSDVAYSKGLPTSVRLFVRHRGVTEANAQVRTSTQAANSLVTACRRICRHRKKIGAATVLAGQHLGIREVNDGFWLASFMRYDLGYFDLKQKTLQPIDNPFGTRLSPMSEIRSVTYLPRPDNLALVQLGGLEPPTS